MLNPFTPFHLNATPDDLAGNAGIGRYILLPGSDGRAKQISQHFSNLAVKTHPRGHHLYLGTISHAGKTIDVATIATGMGCPSMEIILHELFHLGGRRFLRVGTSGSLQPDFVKIGDIVNVQASVRDEHTTTDYMPIDVPAVASFDCVTATLLSAQKLGLSERLHTGTVHCKSSFYAREFGAGPQSTKNKAYINLLTECGILATEMETATLFIQSQFYNTQLMRQGKEPQFRVLWGAILGVIAVPPHQLISVAEEKTTTENVIQLGLETIKTLSML